MSLATWSELTNLEDLEPLGLAVLVVFGLWLFSPSIIGGVELHCLTCEAGASDKICNLNLISIHLWSA